MNLGEQSAARVGYGDKKLAGIEANTSPSANKAKPFQSSKVAAESNANAFEPQVFSERLANENQMWETQYRALGGSRTADNLADIGSTGQLAADASGAAGSLATGNPAGAIANLTRMIAPKLSGQNEATRKLLVQALMSRNAQAALALCWQSLRHD